MEKREPLSGFWKLICVSVCVSASLRLTPYPGGTIHNTIPYRTMLDVATPLSNIDFLRGRLNISISKAILLDMLAACPSLNANLEFVALGGRVAAAS